MADFVDEKRVREVVANELGQPLKITRPEAALEAELGMDSLDHVELCLAVEEEFGIAITDEEAEGWLTVQDIVDTVRKAEQAGGGW